VPSAQVDADRGQGEVRKKRTETTMSFKKFNFVSEEIKGICHIGTIFLTPSQPSPQKGKE